MIRFRYKKSIPLDYDRQGYVYFVSRRYRFLPQSMKRGIRELCREVGGEYHQALFSFVTTDTGSTEICTKHYLSPSTLERLVQKYYTAFAEKF
jgi:hypothetical protein